MHAFQYNTALSNTLKKTSAYGHVCYQYMQAKEPMEKKCPGKCMFKCYEHTGCTYIVSRTWWKCLQSLQFLRWKLQANHAQIFCDLLLKHFTSFVSILVAVIRGVPQHVLMHMRLNLNLFVLSGDSFFCHCPQDELPQANNGQKSSQGW